MHERTLCPGSLILLMTAGLPAVTWLTPPTPAAAQSASIVGHVVDAADQPLSGVSVASTPGSGGQVWVTTTDSDGSYRFEVLPEGTYRVDFELPGFELVRRNHVRVGHGISAEADARLAVGVICECVTIVPATPLRQRAGRVVDEAGRPLPHARLEVVSPLRRDVAYADIEGRFRISAPIHETWPLTASDSGFRSVTRQVSGAVAEPIVLRLAYAGTTGLPESERLSRGCRCPDDFLTSGR